MSSTHPRVLQRRSVYTSVSLATVFFQSHHRKNTFVQGSVSARHHHSSDSGKGQVEQIFCNEPPDSLSSRNLVAEMTDSTAKRLEPAAGKKSKSVVSKILLVQLLSCLVSPSLVMLPEF